MIRVIIWCLIVGAMPVQVYCQQSIFSKDTVEFGRAITDSGLQFGCHYGSNKVETVEHGWSHYTVVEGLKVYCEVSTGIRLVFLNKLNEVAWIDDPRDSAESFELNKDGSVDWSTDHFVSRARTFSFKTLLSHNRIYYSGSSGKKLFQYSLIKTDRLQNYYLSELSRSKPQKSSLEFSYVYDRDTVIPFGELNVDCYKFHRTLSCGDIGTDECREYLYLEKKSLIPFLNISSQYRITYTSKNKDGVLCNPSYSLIRTTLDAPTAYINHLKSP